MKPAKILRNLVNGTRTAMVTNAYDPFTARLAARAGFDMVGIGGYQLGSRLCVSEPLLSLTEVVEATREVARSIAIPLTVDCGAGFGEPLHVMRTVREIEAAGAAALSVEDQIFPKRVHYHRDYRERTIPAEEMVDKVKAMVEARVDPDFVIMARTDAMKTDGFAEGMRRVNLYFEAGADVVKIFPNTLEEAKRAPSEAIGPLYYVNSIGNRVGRPVLTRDMCEQFGYRFLTDAVGTMLSLARAVEQYYRDCIQYGELRIGAEDAIAIRKDIEDVIGLEEMYKVEEATTERK
jgi:2-methylisocitrate lyase-like PEP mutase family enzyme